MGETARAKGSLAIAEGDAFRLKSSNAELLAAKNRKDSRIFTLDERLRSLQDRLRTETAAKEKVVDETIKLEDRMAMLRRRCAQVERSLGNERAVSEQLRRECLLKEEECELMATMVSSPSAIMRLGAGAGGAKPPPAVQQPPQAAEAGGGDANSMQALLEALQQSAELEASLNGGIGDDESARAGDALEQQSVFVAV